MAKQPERQIHKAIMEYLGTLPNYTFFTFDRKGGYDPVRKAFRKVPRPGERKDIKPLDIVGWNHDSGKIIWIEVKRPKPNKTYPDKGQKAFISHCDATSARSFIARSVEETKQKMLDIENILSTCVDKY